MIIYSKSGLVNVLMYVYVHLLGCSANKKKLSICTYNMSNTLKVKGRRKRQISRKEAIEIHLETEKRERDRLALLQVSI